MVRLHVQSYTCAARDSPLLSVLREGRQRATVSKTVPRYRLPTQGSGCRNEDVMATVAARVDLPTVARSVPAARHVTLELLSPWGIEHCRDDAALVITELVTNVVDHVRGQTSIVVELTFSDGWLRISIADGSAVRPVVRELCGHQPRGRGMHLVAAVAERWDCEDHHG